MPSYSHSELKGQRSCKGFEVADDNYINSFDTLNTDPATLLEAKENDGIQNALVSTLFNPLESELDESLDVAMELDISLSESFDVTEVLAITEKGYHSVSTSIGEDLIGKDVAFPLDCNENILKPNEARNKRAKIFKQSFKLLPVAKADVKFKRRRTRSSSKVEPAVSSVGMADHSYHKIPKEVKFTVKARTSATVQKSAVMNCALIQESMQRNVKRKCLMKQIQVFSVGRYTYICLFVRLLLSLLELVTTLLSIPIGCSLITVISKTTAFTDYRCNVLVFHLKVTLIPVDLYDYCFHS